MRKQTRGVLSSLITDMKAGLIPRRTLLKQAACMGLTGSILALLESCDSTPPPCSATKLTWWSERNDIDTYNALFSAYNSTNNCRIIVSPSHEKSINTDILHKQLTQTLDSRKYHFDDPDIISMDVIWTDEFASNGWVVPLNNFWPAKEQSSYLLSPIQASTYQGQIYAAPFRTDVGLMYYRTDLEFGPNSSGTIPQTWTWDDLEGMVQYARSHNGPDPLPPYGYLWQATDQQQPPRPYEGLVCNFLEVLSSYGGSVVDDLHSPKHITIISSSAAIEALQKMRSWLSPGNISPFDFRTSISDGGTTADIWKKGDAMFMRNWPTRISDSNKDTSQVQEKFGITTLPVGNNGHIGRSCIGGWGLAINAFTSQEKRDAAWNFIEWMLREDVQIFAAIDASFTMTHKNVYNNHYLKQQNPFYPQIKDIIDKHSQSRPQLPNYHEFSQAMQKQIYQILTDPSPDINRSLNTLQKMLQDIIDKGKKNHK